MGVLDLLDLSPLLKFGQPAPIHIKILSRDIPRRIRRQQHRDPRQILRLAPTPQHRARRPLRPSLGIIPAQRDHIRVEIARPDRIDPDPAPRQIVREKLRQLFEPALGRPIRRIVPRATVAILDWRYPGPYLRRKSPEYW